MGVDVTHSHSGVVVEYEYGRRMKRRINVTQNVDIFPSSTFYQILLGGLRLVHASHKPTVVVYLSVVLRVVHGARHELQRLLYLV